MYALLLMLQSATRPRPLDAGGAGAFAICYLLFADPYGYALIAVAAQPPKGP